MKKDIVPLNSLYIQNMMAPSNYLLIFCFIIPSYGKEVHVKLILCNMNIHNDVKGHGQEMNSLPAVM